MIKNISIKENPTSIYNKIRISSDFYRTFKDKQEKKIGKREYENKFKSDDLDASENTSELAYIMDIEDLSREITKNLLSQAEGTRKYADLNNTDISENVEMKKNIFPPITAPDSVKSVWKEVTSKMTSSEVIMAKISLYSAQIAANIHSIPNGKSRIISPGEPGYKSAFGNSAADYHNTLNYMVNYLSNSSDENNNSNSKLIHFQLKVLNKFLNNISSDS